VSASIFQLKTFLNYWLDAVDEHSLHSPFLFNFFKNVIRSRDTFPYVEKLRTIRKSLQEDHRTIHVADLGAGSIKLKTAQRKISDITKISTTPEKYSNLYARIITYFKCQHVLELGTSVGINTMYLAKANPEANIITFEGSPEVSMVADEMFLVNGVANIRLIEGNIDFTLPSYLSHCEKIDFAMIDANHRFEPTMRYFEWLLQKSHRNTILVVDDIHYSRDMEQAWHTMKAHQSVNTTIDLYRCGLIFFDPSLTKQNVVLQF
jgi:predicted O-methyltransferase YrrM